MTRWPSLFLPSLIEAFTECSVPVQQCAPDLGCCVHCHDAGICCYELEF